MFSLRQTIEQAEKNKTAIGHFNVSDLVMLRAILEAARKVGVAVIIGLSEGEREFVGVRSAAALIKSLRQEYDFPIYLNADHTRSLIKAKEAAVAGFDAVLFDAGSLPLEENIRRTKEAVGVVKSINTDILVEGELGYIGSGSEVFEELPPGAAIAPEDMTKPEEAERFVKETGVDLLAPAVGNVHGMFADAPNPHLDIERIRAVRRAAGVPLVLHGGSGIRAADFLAAIDAGVRIIHLSTELRRAWREGMEAGLHGDEKEIAPYKIAQPALAELEEIVISRLRLFSRLP